MKHHITFWSVIVRFVGSGPADAFLGAFIRSETQPSSSSFPVHQQFRIEGVDRRPDVNAYTLAVSPLFTPPHGIDMFPSWLRWLRIGPTSTRQNTLHRRTTVVVRILGRSFECSRESRRRRRILLFRFELKKEKEKVKKVLIGDDLFRYIYPPVVEDEYKATVSLLRSFRGNECIECAPSSGPRRSSVSNERESYLITNVWGVLETMVDREVKYRSLRPESWWKQFYWVRMDGISNFAIRLRGVCLVVKYQSRKIVWSCIFVDALYVQRLEKNRQSVLPRNYQSDLKMGLA